MKPSRELDALRECAEALDRILRTVSLDWYVQQFARDESASGAETGIAAVIHNREMRDRAAVAFERGRIALAALRAVGADGGSFPPNCKLGERAGA